MNATDIYIGVSILALLVMALLLFTTARARRGGRLTRLAGLAFAFILAGILFGENRLIGYGLLGVGVVLAIIDIIRKSRGPVG